jgi:hypothetical protein
MRGLLFLAVTACSSNGSVFDAGPSSLVDGGIFDEGCGFCMTDTGSPTVTCSPDLHSIVDSNGDVIQTCPPDQGCSASACVPACQAAADSHGTIGCDFMVATPSFFAGSSTYSSPCFAVFLANNWAENSVLSVDRNGTTYDPTKFGRVSATSGSPTTWPSVSGTGLPQGNVAVLFMDDNPSDEFPCPVTPAISTATGFITTGKGQAWHIATTFPVSAYDIMPFGGASSLLPGASLLYPTTAWGTNYIAALPKFGGSPNAGNPPGPQWGQIVAFQDNTSVEIIPTVALPGSNGVASAPQNTKTTYALNAGEFIQWQPTYSEYTGTVPMDMSGSIIQSNNPIAFNGGNGYLCLGSATTTGGGCDSDHEQIAPIQALGSSYAIVPFEPRLPYTPQSPESVLYRFTGTVNGTTLTYDPPQSGLPTTLSLGQVVDFESEHEFVVSSQDNKHPFHAALMMPGCVGENGLGDEDYGQFVPPAQFLSSYVFYSDVTYQTTTFTVVRSKGLGAFQDVDIDCVGDVTGWAPVDSQDTVEFAWVDIVTANVPQHNNCQNGPHSATSKGPFGITVWGLDFAASYGYPAGGNLAAINTVVVPPVPN